MRCRNQRGAALLFVLIMILIISMLSAGIMFTVHYETQISANYKYSQQSLLAANAGIQSAIQWFSTSYVPANSDTYDISRSPVAYNGKPVNLAGQAASNYPNARTASSFQAALGNQPLLSGGGRGGYSVNATCLKISFPTKKAFDPDTFLIGLGPMERWSLQSQGTQNSTGTDSIGNNYISAEVEQSRVPFFSRAIWSRKNISLTGSILIDSYDADAPYGGDNANVEGSSIASNDSVTFSSDTRIKGYIYYYGSLIGRSGAVVDGGEIRMPRQRPSSLFPPIPSFTPGSTDVNIADTKSQDLPPGAYGKIILNGNAELRIQSGSYYIDQITTSDKATIKVFVNSTTNEPARLFVKSQLQLANSAIVLNASPIYKPRNLQIYYSGTSNAQIWGLLGFYGVVYVPNANLKLINNDLYGAVIAQDVEIDTAKIHYDKHLMEDFIIIKYQPFNIVSWRVKN